MEEVARGAEAVLYRTDGELVKDRVEKGYRLEELDSRLRRERTKTEARLLREARRAGVLTPQVREERDTEIEMEFVEGEKVRDLIPELSDGEKEELAREIGRYAGRLHRNGIVHGDLTTSNMILRGGIDDLGKGVFEVTETGLYLIDFGLGEFSDSVEDRAVDLYLLREALESTHHPDLELLWEGVLEGYKEEMEGAERVLKRLERIGYRGRYTGAMDEE